MALILQIEPDLAEARAEVRQLRQEVEQLEGSYRQLGSAQAPGQPAAAAADNLQDQQIIQRQRLRAKALEAQLSQESEQFIRNRDRIIDDSIARLHDADVASLDELQRSRNEIIRIQGEHNRSYVERIKALSDDLNRQLYGPHTPTRGEEAPRVGVWGP